MSDELVDAAKVALRSGSGFERLEDGVGRSVPRTWAALFSHSDETFASYERFLVTSERLGVSADPAVVKAYLRELDVLEAAAPTVKGLSGAQRQELIDELQRFRRGTASTPASTSSATAVTKPKAGTVAYSAARSGTAARISRVASDRLRAAAADRSTAAATRAADAVDMMTSVIGPSHTEGWDAAFNSLAENLQRIKEVEERYVAAKAAVASGHGPIAAAQEELTKALEQRQGLHSKLKGFLGEAYTSRCQEFLDLREAFEDLARHRVEALNARARAVRSDVQWEVVPIRGDIKIDDLESWDEAVLIVEKLRPGMTGLPRAQVVMTAQYKVEKRVSALNQITRDRPRELGDVTQAARLSFTDTSGARRAYQLLPSTPATQPKRFFFNASGEERLLGRRRFQAGEIEAQQAKLKASIDQFNAVADELLASALAAAQ